MNTWLLLRGLTREHRHWGEFPQALAAEWPGSRILAPDLAGNGALHRVASPATVEAMAQECRARLFAQGHRPPFHLLAMSLGGMVAVAWAQRHPQEVAACVLVNTSMRPFSPVHQRLRPQQYARLVWLLFGAGAALAREAQVLAMTSRGGPAADALPAQWAAYRRECPVTRANALRQLWAAARFRAGPAPPPAPVLVLTSARDRLVDTRCSQGLARAWSAPIRVHPQAGHDLPLDDAGWVVQQVSDWLAQMPLAAAAGGGGPHGPESLGPPDRLSHPQPSRQADA